MSRIADAGTIYDLVVIGGGSAGLTLDRYGARIGAEVAIIEAKGLGGNCTWYGCVPSKALLASAHMAAGIRQAGTLGLPESDLSAINLGRVADRIAGIPAECSRTSIPRRRATAERNNT